MKPFRLKFEAYAYCLVQLKELQKRYRKGTTLSLAIENIQIQMANHQPQETIIIDILKNLGKSGKIMPEDLGLINACIQRIEASNFKETSLGEYFGNTWSRRFESEWAIATLFNPTFLIMQSVKKISSKILELIKLLEPTHKAEMQKMFSKRKALSFGIHVRQTLNDVKKILENNQPEYLIEIMAIHFQFSQNFTHNHALNSKSHPKPPDEILKYLSAIWEDTPNIMDIYSVKGFYGPKGQKLRDQLNLGMYLSNLYRADPNSNRGRASFNGKFSSQLGLMLNEEKYETLGLAKHSTEWQPDCLCQDPDIESPYVRDLILNETPWVAGFSGMATLYLSQAMLFNVFRTQEEYALYQVAFSAYIVSGGFHSLHEALAPGVYFLKLIPGYQIEIPTHDKLAEPPKYQIFFDYTKNIDPEFNFCIENMWKHFGEWLKISFNNPRYDLIEEKHELPLMAVKKIPEIPAQIRDVDLDEDLHLMSKQDLHKISHTLKIGRNSKKEFAPEFKEVKYALSKVVNDHDQEEVIIIYKGIKSPLKTTLGSGTFGSVKIGVRENGAYLAIKKSIYKKPDMNEEDVNEYKLTAENEIKTLKKLNRLIAYEHIIKNEGTEEETRQYNIYMPLYEGISLEALLQSPRKDALSPHDWITMCLNVISEIDFLHKNLILNCDIKPANFILTTDGNIKSIDFGLSQICEEKLVYYSKYVCDTPGYGAPELYLQEFKGNDDNESIIYNEKTDIYSLGITLKQLLNYDENCFIDSDNYSKSRLGNNSISKEAHALLDLMTTGNPEDRPTLSDIKKQFELFKHQIIATPAINKIAFVSVDDLLKMQLEEQNYIIHTLGCYRDVILTDSYDKSLIRDHKEYHSIKALFAQKSILISKDILIYNNEDQLQTLLDHYLQAAESQSHAQIDAKLFLNNLSSLGATKLESIGVKCLPLTKDSLLLELKSDNNTAVSSKIIDETIHFLTNEYRELQQDKNPDQIKINHVVDTVKKLSGSKKWFTCEFYLELQNLERKLSAATHVGMFGLFSRPNVTHMKVNQWIEQLQSTTASMRK